MNSKALDRSVKYIDSWLKLRYEYEEIPGYVVAISLNDKILLNKAYGYANLEKKQKLTPDHIFRIASHSKTFTATALMQLQEKGKIRIDEYIADYLVWLKDHKDKRWQKVTIRQLMCHGAGIIRDGNNSNFWQLERPFPDAKELKQEILQAKLVIDNNTKLKYSNYGFSLLGLLIEKVSGQPYNQYVIENIVKPLGLNNTGPEYTASIGNKLATGYTSRRDKTRLPIDNIDTRALSPATGFYSTAADLCRYFVAQFVGSNKLLDDESKKEMQRVHFHAYTPGQDNNEDYALGIELEYVKARTTIGHGGGFPGYITKSIGDPKDKIVIVVLTNCHDGPAAMIAKNIFGIIDYFQEKSSDKKPKYDLSRFEGRYMGLGSVADFVVIGDKVNFNYPNCWQPFSYIEELEYKNDTTLKITKADSFSNEGEEAIFSFKNGQVESVSCGGYTLWPEKAWLEKQKGKKIISLPFTQ